MTAVSIVPQTVRTVLSLALALGPSACGATPHGAVPLHDAGMLLPDGGIAPSSDASMAEAASADASATASNIAHLVVIVQEGHSFDSYFGNYCTGVTGSNPTCNTGTGTTPQQGCCEAAPTSDPGSGDHPIVLDDTTNAVFDPNHLQACELQEIDNGKMDMYVKSSLCGSPKNYAVADLSTARRYVTLAQTSAIADHYFQPIAGQSSSNDMYFARAHYVFRDNTVIPKSIGSTCGTGTPGSYTDPTIGDLLNARGVSWAWYSEGYKVMVDSEADGGKCPAPPADCQAGVSSSPCLYDPSDVPFEYYESLQDSPQHMLDFAKFAGDIGANALPAISFVKPLGYKSEHPGRGILISEGMTFATAVIDAIAKSPYASSTLILLTYAESGGFFDHIAPPSASPIDQQPYGPRVPLMAIGPFAKTNFVSHVEMEHSSIVKFIEWNWLGQNTGQLGGRDTVVSNIGSLLDASATGVEVPP
jgi:phospholipase C